MKKQAGFTLIELIMVIVILGILAAVALPKFVDLGSDARKAAMKGVEGSMHSTNAIIYARAAVANQMANTGSVTIAGTAVTTKYGFANDANELKKVMDISTDFTVAAADIRHAGATAPANCKVVYTPAAAASSPPTYVRTDSGC